MKISIIIPVYNVADYITACLSSVVAQDWEGEIECIIVDDCGTDSSMEIVESFVASYSGKIEFKILHHRKNRGLSVARNTACEVATGDYIFYLDSDDEITPECLRLLAAPLSERAYDVVVGNWISSKSDVPVNRFKKRKYDGDEIISTYFTGEFQMAVWNKLFRRDFLKRWNLSFIEGEICEDVQYSGKVAMVAESLYAVDVVTYKYTVRKDSIIGRKKGDTSFGNSARLAEYIRFIEGNGLWGRKSIIGVIDFYVRVFLGWSSDGFLNRYLESRRIVRKSWLFFARNDGFNLKRQIRDLHYAFPPHLGAVCYFAINRTLYSKYKRFCLWGEGILS